VILGRPATGEKGALEAEQPLKRHWRRHWLPGIVTPRGGGCDSQFQRRRPGRIPPICRAFLAVQSRPL